MASTMPLTIKPTIVGSGPEFKVRYLEAAFDNGYRQRAADGKNPVDITLSLQWVGTNTEIDELITHFEERAGYQSFTIADADIAEDVNYKWTCNQWSLEHNTNNIATLIAVLRKENDLT